MIHNTYLILKQWEKDVDVMPYWNGEGMQSRAPAKTYLRSSMHTTYDDMLLCGRSTQQVVIDGGQTEEMGCGC